MWIVLSLLSALAAGVTATLSKAGFEKVNATVGTGIQAIVILLLTWGIVAFQGNLGEVSKIDRRSLLFLLASGVVTTAAYLFYFGALKQGEANRVAPLDRLSLVFAVIFAAVFLKEKLTTQTIIGAGLMAAGALVVAFAKK